jgi:hypothetical protein
LRKEESPDVAVRAFFVGVAKKRYSAAAAVGREHGTYSRSLAVDSAIIA